MQIGGTTKGDDQLQKKWLRNWGFVTAAKTLFFVGLADDIDPARYIQNTSALNTLTLENIRSGFAIENNNTKTAKPYVLLVSNEILKSIAHLL